jgi:hypothetical protein
VLKIRDQADAQKRQKARKSYLVGFAPRLSTSKPIFLWFNSALMKRNRPRSITKSASAWRSYEKKAFSSSVATFRLRSRQAQKLDVVPLPVRHGRKSCVPEFNSRSTRSGSHAMIFK